MLIRKTGQFFGETRCQETASGVLLSENRYYPGQTTPRHIHETPLFYLVLDGLCHEKVKQKASVHTPSTLVFLAAGESHATQWSPETGGRCFHLELSASFRKFRLPEGTILSKAASLHQSTGTPPVLMRKLYMEFLHWDRHSALIAEGVVLELLGELDRVQATASTRNGQWLARVESRLREQPEATPMLTELAELADVHPSHLLRAFRQQYRVTPGEFVRQLRIEEACRRLHNVPEIALGTLALELGFADQSHFCRTFRRITGVTPGAYRQMQGIQRK